MSSYTDDEINEALLRAAKAMVPAKNNVVVFNVEPHDYAILQSLATEYPRLKADAERYRYWRDSHGWTGYFDDGASNSDDPAAIDAAIDAARGKEGK